MDALIERSNLMKESLQRSETITNDIISTLGSFDHRLSALSTTTQPIQMRMQSLRTTHENIDKTFKFAGILMAQFQLSRQAEAKILKGPHEDLESYLEAIDQLKNNVKFFGKYKQFRNADAVINHSNNLLTKSVSKLEDEFKQLLFTYSKPVAPDLLMECLPQSLRPSGGDLTETRIRSREDAVYTIPLLMPARIQPLVQNIAKQMFQAWHHQQLLKIYRDNRSPVLEESLRKLGLEKLSKDDAQRLPWDVLKDKIGNWIHFMRVAFKVLFVGERALCDRIFEGVGALREQCFAEATASSVELLIGFGDAVNKTKKSPEKLFVFLEMYEIMRELRSEIESLFDSKSCDELREAAVGLRKRFAETAEETLAGFEELVEKDTSKTALSDGNVLPLTSYVINYLKFLLDYLPTLQQLYLEGGHEDSKSYCASVIMRIMQALQTNLDGKSKQLKDPALTHVFLMNNIHYIVRSVRRSEAKDLLGDDWVQRHRRIVQQQANQYKRIAWAKILLCLSVQDMSSTGSSKNDSSGVSRTLIKDKLKAFNGLFEELHQRQSQWIVPDAELRESLRLAVAEVLVPAYRSFIKRFRNLVDAGKNPQKYIRYSPEDLESLLGEFFEGKNACEAKR